MERLRYEASLDAYVISVEPLEQPGGGWVYRAGYPDLPGVECTARNVLAAIDGADRERDVYLKRLSDRHEPSPPGRPTRLAPLHGEPS